MVSVVSMIDDSIDEFLFFEEMQAMKEIIGTRSRQDVVIGIQCDLQEIRTSFLSLQKLK